MTDDADATSADPVSVLVALCAGASRFRDQPSMHPAWRPRTPYAITRRWAVA